jgi:predicted transcriptional regulator
MKRTTISLPEPLAAALGREARRRRVPVSQIAREAIEERLGRNKRRRRLSFIGIARGGEPTTAADAEEILRREWAPDRDR